MTSMIEKAERYANDHRFAFNIREWIYDWLWTVTLAPIVHCDKLLIISIPRHWHEHWRHPVSLADASKPLFLMLRDVGMNGSRLYARESGHLCKWLVIPKLEYGLPICKSKLALDSNDDSRKKCVLLSIVRILFVFQFSTLRKFRLLKKALLWVVPTIPPVSETVMQSSWTDVTKNIKTLPTNLFICVWCSTTTGQEDLRVINIPV